MGSIFIIFIQSRALPLVEIHCETVLSLDEIVILLRQLLYSSSYIPQRQLKSLKVQCEGPLSPFTVAQGWFRGKKRIYKRRWRHKSNDPTHHSVFMSISDLCSEFSTLPASPHCARRQQGNSYSKPGKYRGEKYSLALLAEFIQIV